MPYPTLPGWGSSVAVSPRLCIGIWFAGMACEAAWLDGRSGGASLSALVAGSLAGLLLAREVPGTLPRDRPGPAPAG